MGDTTSMNLRIDKELKRQAEELFAELGINTTTAINIFLRQSVRDRGIPFRLSAVPLEANADAGEIRAQLESILNGKG